MTALHPSWNENSAWFQEHGHVGTRASGAAFAQFVEGQVRNLDGSRGRGNGHTDPPIR